MKKSFLAIFLTIICAVFCASVYADTYTQYDASDAADYATTNYNADYGSGSGENPFGDFSPANCTNFVSQCIIAGMTNSDDMDYVYAQRYNFDIDAGGGTYQWYYISYSNRGPAFTGADKLYEYAVNNYPAYKGLHFEYVTHDTENDFMDYQDVEVGDVIFADWENDGTFDHSMIVTNIQTWRLGYNEIRLTYQGSQYETGKTNIGLGDLNEQFNYEAVFHVYRPTDYNPSGL